MAQHAGQQLLDEVRRALRAPAGQAPGRMALALRLSEMAAPRPHHLRVARALLQDAAARGGGQVFTLANTDVVLLFQSADSGAALSATLLRLFTAGAPAPDLLSVWPLPQGTESLIRYAEARAADPPILPTAAGHTVERPGERDTAAALDAVVGQTPLADLMQRQAAVLFNAGSGRLLPLYQEITLSVPVLKARIAAVGHAGADPFLLQHLAARLDVRMLEALRVDLLEDGPWSAAARRLGPTLHVNLSVASILSDRFAPFAAASRTAGARVGVEVTLLEAFQDAEAFARAQDRLRLAGMALTLDRVSHDALLLTRLAVLQPDLVKLEWSPLLPLSGAGRALEELGPGRVVLHQADTEDALSWGVAHGIRRFQGRHIDAMLAAGRLGACAYAGGCSLRQCTERAYATGPAGRAGCSSPALLDGAPLLLARAAS